MLFFDDGCRVKVRPFSWFRISLRDWRSSLSICWTVLLSYWGGTGTLAWAACRDLRLFSAENLGFAENIFKCILNFVPIGDWYSNAYVFLQTFVFILCLVFTGVGLAMHKNPSMGSRQHFKLLSELQMGSYAPSYLKQMAIRHFCL